MAAGGVALISQLAQVITLRLEHGLKLAPLHAQVRP